MKRCNIVVLIPVGLAVFVGIILTVLLLMPIIIAAMGAEALGCDERSARLFALLDRLTWWE